MRCEVVGIAQESHRLFGQRGHWNKSTIAFHDESMLLQLSVAQAKQQRGGKEEAEDFTIRDFR